MLIFGSYYFIVMMSLNQCDQNYVLYRLCCVLLLAFFSYNSKGRGGAIALALMFCSYVSSCIFCLFVFFLVFFF